MTLMTLREFSIKYNVPLPKMRDRVFKRQIRVAGKHNGRLKGFIYHEKDLIDMMKSFGDDVAKSYGWIGLPVGTIARITNVAGRSWIGRIAGYKGTVLGRLQLQEGEIPFAVDAKIEEMPPDTPIDKNSGIIIEDRITDEWKRIFHLNQY